MDDAARRPSSVRRANLSRLLRVLHEQGPLSRAALTQLTGLNKSTIGDLVSQLASDRLVDERQPEPTQRAGRPSPVIAARGDVFAIAVNPEVDAITIGLVGFDRSLRERERIVVERAPSPEEVAHAVAHRLERWREAELSDARFAGVGVAVPALVRASDGLVRLAPHLEWRDAPLGDLIAAATGLPTAVGNDATLGVLAEHRYGAAQGVSDVVYLNGGASGIGGGLVVDGRAVRGAGGYAGEFGQNRPGIATDDDRHAADGVLEDEVSRARLLQVLGMSDADERQLADALDGAVGAAVHDEVARQRRILATALANAANVLNPSVIVLGGFLATLAELDLSGLSASVAAQSLPMSAEHLDIRVAALAEDRLLVGAGEVAFEALISGSLRFEV